MIGRLEWAAIQDWMCEPSILGRTGRTIKQHQALTVRSLLTLRDLAPEVPWLPVVQGWELVDYLRHVDMYERAGVDLGALPVVGVGSVCRRQGTSEATAIIQALAGRGLGLHAFGFKTRGLLEVGRSVVSADSMAWSYRARRRPALPDCSHASCSNCLEYALAWRRSVLDRLRVYGKSSEDPAI